MITVYDHSLSGHSHTTLIYSYTYGVSTILLWWFAFGPCCWYFRDDVKALSRDWKWMSNLIYVHAQNLTLISLLELICIQGPRNRGYWGKPPPPHTHTFCTKGKSAFFWKESDHFHPWPFWIVTPTPGGRTPPRPTFEVIPWPLFAFNRLHTRLIHSVPPLP